MPDDDEVLLEELSTAELKRRAEARAAAVRQVLEAAHTPVAGAPTSTPASGHLKKCYERPDAERFLK
jgi:hypothetical protein